MKGPCEHIEYISQGFSISRGGDGIAYRTGMAKGKGILSVDLLEIFQLLYHCIYLVDGQHIGVPARALTRIQAKATEAESRRIHSRIFLNTIFSRLE